MADEVYEGAIGIDLGESTFVKNSFKCRKTFNRPA
jgi:hypothetical protein